MNTKHLLCGAAASAFLLATTSLQAADLRWLGLDMNTNADSLSTPLVHVDTQPTPIAGLVSLPFGAGANLIPLAGTTGPVVSGTSFATTSWSINAPADTLTLSLNHGVTGLPSAGNFAGSEGVVYFYALTAGVLEVTYDYGIEEVTDPTEPYKASERGRSKGTVRNNARGLGDDVGGPTETVNRDGSRTFYANVSPSDDLLALQFDFQILDLPQDTSIPAGYLTMSFTPVPEPASAALLGLGGLALLARRRARR